MKRLFKSLATRWALWSFWSHLLRHIFKLKGLQPTPIPCRLKSPICKYRAIAHRLQEAQKSASMLCNGCHEDFQTGKLTGHIMTDLPKEFGTVASYNITQDKIHGIGDWTDGEIYYYLRRGIR